MIALDNAIDKAINMAIKDIAYEKKKTELIGLNVLYKKDSGYEIGIHGEVINKNKKVNLSKKDRRRLKKYETN